MRSTKILKENKENIIFDETETQKNKKLNVKITLLTIFFLLFVIFLGIFNQMSQVPEGTKLYKQDIDVVVTEIRKSETPRYTGISVIYDYDVDVTVYSIRALKIEQYLLCLFVACPRTVHLLMSCPCLTP